MSLACSRARGSISSYLDGRLSPGQTTDLERHVATCSGCRDRLDQTSRLRGLLHAFVEEPLEGVPLDRILGGVRAQYGQAERRPRSRHVLLWAVAILGAGIVVGLAGSAAGRGEREAAPHVEAAPTSGPAPVPEQPDPRPADGDGGRPSGEGLEEGALALTCRDESLLDSVERLFDGYPGSARITRRGDLLEVVYSGRPGPEADRIHEAVAATIEENRPRFTSIRASRHRRE